MSAIEFSPELTTVSRRHVAFLVLLALAASLVVASPTLHSNTAPSAGVETRAAGGYGSLPISFEPNVGQAPGRYDFVARGQGFGMAINATGATLALGTNASDVLRVHLLGASGSATLRTLEVLPGTVNYFIGNDPSRWRSNVPTFRGVSYGDVWQGIDVTYHGANAGTLEYDFVVAAGADPGDIRLGFPGASHVALRSGNLVISTAHGAVTQQAPVLYQTIAGRRVLVDGGFSLAGDDVAFEVGAYDHHHPLIIDPTLIYSTYLGGSDEDKAQGIAVDGMGHAFVTGGTKSMGSTTFLPGGFGPGGTSDAFVTELNDVGTALIYSTYLGGTGGDGGFGIALDGTGAAYVTGSTNSTDFPTTAGVFQPQKAGDTDAFVTKLDPTGSMLAYSTYLGGAGNPVAQGNDIAYAIAVDGAGQAYVTGNTTADFPVTPGSFQGSNQGGFGTNIGSGDAFVTKLADTGQSLVYSTYLGGTGGDIAFGIGVDSDVAFVTGVTSSTDFPMESALQSQNAGGSDAFVTLVNDTGQALKNSTYLGGGSDDIARAIGVHGFQAYVTGSTGSDDFPVTSGSFQTHLAGNGDVFVTRLDYQSGLIYSTFLGGSGGDGVGIGDGGGGIAVDGLGQAYVTGSTLSTDFPLQAPLLGHGTNAGSLDAFVTKLNASGSVLTYSTYLGGSLRDPPQGIAVDPTGAAYVAGYTVSTNFPTTPTPGPAPLQGSLIGVGPDAFVAKLAEIPPPPCDDHPVTIEVTSPGLTTTGTTGPDVINGTSGVDTIDGGGGDDIICGLGDNDRLFGGKGNDKLFGGAGGDDLWGEEGNDILEGNAGDDTFFGDAGNDYSYGNAGDDVLFDQAGSDHLYGNGDDDVLFGDVGNDYLYGNAGDDALFGEDGNDHLYGNIGNDDLLGQDGSDDLNGNAGQDDLLGGNGGSNNDSCDGGAPTPPPAPPTAFADTGTECEVSIDIP